MPKFKIYKYILLCLTILFTVSTQAASPSKRKIYGFFINGINNSYKQANNNAVALWKTANVDSNLFSKNDGFYLLYNEIPKTKCPMCTQLADVFMQKALIKLDVIIDDFMAVYIRAKSLDPNVYHKGTPEYNALETVLLDKFKLEPGVSEYFGSNLSDIESKYNEVMNSSGKILKDFLLAQNSEPYILLLGHSQGSLYVQQLYNYITTGAKPISPKHVATFVIANPSGVADNHLQAELAKLFVGNPPPPYVTAIQDHVILGANLLLKCVAPNISGSLDSWSLSTTLGHSLTDYYLIDKEIQPKIQVYIDQYLIYLQMAIYTDSYTSDNAFVYFSPKNSSMVDPNGHTICDHGMCEKFAQMEPQSTFYLHTPALPRRKSDSYYLVPVTITGTYIVLTDKIFQDSIDEETFYTDIDQNDLIYDNPGLCNGKMYPIYVWDNKQMSPHESKVNVTGCNFYGSKFNSAFFMEKFPELTINGMFRLAWIKGVK